MLKNNCSLYLFCTYSVIHDTEAWTGGTYWYHVPAQMGNAPGYSPIFKPSPFPITMSPIWEIKHQNCSIHNLDVGSSVETQVFFSFFHPLPQAALSFPSWSDWSPIWGPLSNLKANEIKIKMTQCFVGETSLFDWVAQLKVGKIKRPEGSHCLLLSGELRCGCDWTEDRNIMLPFRLDPVFK